MRPAVVDVAAVTTLTRVRTSEALRRRARLVSGLIVGLVALSGPAWAAPPPVAEPGGCTVKPGFPASAEIPWAQERLGFERVHALATGAGITVAVVDSGLNVNNQPQVSSLESTKPTNVMGGGGYGATDVNDCEDYGHGTRVAAIIAAQQEDGVGFEGLAPDATIMPIKYRDSSSQDVGGDAAAVARGIEAAIAAKVDVINLSLQSPDTPELRAAVEHAKAADIVVVAASGNNDGQGVPALYPAKYAEGKDFPNVLVVGASDANDAIAQFSITGDYVGVAAPGVGILAPTQIQGYYAEDGTSFATPFVSATVALVRERHPRLSAEQVVNRIKATADRPGVSVPDAGYGWGIVNPYVAITAERDDSRILPQQAKLPAVPAPNLPEPPDHTLRDRGYAVAAGLLGAALLFGVGSIAWRHTAERRGATADGTQPRG